MCPVSILSLPCVLKDVLYLLSDRCEIVARSLATSKARGRDTVSFGKINVSIETSSDIKTSKRPTDERSAPVTATGIENGPTKGMSCLFLI